MEASEREGRCRANWKWILHQLEREAAGFTGSCDERSVGGWAQMGFRRRSRSCGYVRSGGDGRGDPFADVYSSGEGNDSRKRDSHRPGSSHWHLHIDCMVVLLPRHCSCGRRDTASTGEGSGGASNLGGGATDAWPERVRRTFIRSMGGDCTATASSITTRREHDEHASISTDGCAIAILKTRAATSKVPTVDPFVRL